MDLRRMGHKTKEGYIELSEEEVDLVRTTLSNWQSPDYKNLYKDVPEFCKSVTNELIKNEGQNISLDEDKSNWPLIPSKYIEFIDHDLEIDFPKEMERIQTEMKELLKEERDSQKQLIDA